MGPNSQVKWETDLGFVSTSVPFQIVRSAVVTGETCVESGGRADRRHRPTFRGGQKGSEPRKLVLGTREGTTGHERCWRAKGGLRGDR